MSPSPTKPVAFRYLPFALDLAAQKALADAIVNIMREAPPFTPTMPRTGKPFSVAMTNCGPLGWVSDKTGGYRYQATHPETGKPWPAMPNQLLEVWRRFSGCSYDPEACLINVYAGTAKMGSHQDRDEADFAAPVLSISLGDDAKFHVGGLEKNRSENAVYPPQRRCGAA